MSIANIVWIVDGFARLRAGVLNIGVGVNAPRFRHQPLQLWETAHDLKYIHLALFIVHLHPSNYETP